MAIERERPSAAKPGNAGGSGTPDQTIRRTTNFLKETIVELQKTIWPTQTEAWNLTAVVLVVILVLGIYMGLLDYGMTAIVSKFSLIK